MRQRMLVCCQKVCSEGGKVELGEEYLTPIEESRGLVVRNWITIRNRTLVTLT